MINSEKSTGWEVFFFGSEIFGAQTGIKDGLENDEEVLGVSRNKERRYSAQENAESTEGDAWM